MSNVKRALQDEAHAASVLLANLRDLVAGDDQAHADLVEGETGLLDAIGQAVDRLAEIEVLTEAISGLVKSYSERKSRLENQADGIRAALAVAMGMAELKKIELPQATLSRKPTPPKALIIEEADVPPTFWKPQPPKLDKKAVLDALKAGESVPGAQLSNGGETIAIRRS